MPARTITVKVTDALELGLPVAGATVRLTPAGRFNAAQPEVTRVTNQAGEASGVTLEEGPYTYTIEASGYHATSGVVDVRRDGVYEFVLMPILEKRQRSDQGGSSCGCVAVRKVEAPPRLRVKVVTQDREAVEGATVCVDGDCAATDWFGEASFAVREGVRAVRVSKPGYAEVARSVQVRGDTTLWVTLTAQGGAAQAVQQQATQPGGQEGGGEKGGVATVTNPSLLPSQQQGGEKEEEKKGEGAGSTAVSQSKAEGEAKNGLNPSQPATSGGQAGGAASGESSSAGGVGMKIVDADVALSIALGRRVKPSERTAAEEKEKKASPVILYL